jgi:arginine decarboxylase-like protein
MKNMTGKVVSEDSSQSVIDQQVELFFHLTREALNADSPEAFFDSLQKREKLVDSFEQLSASLSPDSISRMLFIERKILIKLESERRKTMKDIDKLSRQMKTLKTYTAKFPFPSMPAFFDLAR